MRVRVLRGVMDYFDGLDMELDTMCDGEVVEMSQARSLSERLAGATPARNITASTKILRAVQGTIILHINSAVKHDPLLSKELVRA